MLEKKKIGGRMRRSHIPPGIKTNAMWSRLLNRRATSEPAPHRTSPKGGGGAVQRPLACRGPCTPQDHLIDALNPRHSRDQQKPKKKHTYIHTYIHTWPARGWGLLVDLQDMASQGLGVATCRTWPARGWGLRRPRPWAAKHKVQQGRGRACGPGLLSTVSIECVGRGRARSCLRPWPP